MELKVFNKNPYEQNTYIYYEPETKVGVIIDPGFSKTQIVKALDEFDIKAIILTHGHHDHIFSLQKVVELTPNAKVFAHEMEKELLADPTLNLSNPYGEAKDVKAAADTYVNEDEVISAGNISLRVIYTPGHTIGGMCLYDCENGVLFSGDTLFKENVGRTDLPTGNTEQLTESIKTKLFVLPPETKVYSGHGEPTTIGHEIKNNVYV
ncbi:MAG: MBL fold metallo-hydrolase [Defluviitaleaceae bacterium]|nr:MBL fold metallo-hydrolase [Defluviitaleaceae bacterium]